jgi:hypothetical protein
MDDKTQITLNLEYPGRTLLEALSEANERAYEALEIMKVLRARIQDAQYLLDHAEDDHARAIQASNMFQAALDEGAE